MQVYRGLDDSILLSRPVAAVGSFDGVHLGHCQILRYLVAYAREHSMQSVVVTFDPHPRTVLHPASDFFTINTLEENLHLIEQQGIDATIIQPFTVDFSKRTYRQFIQEVIVGALHAHTLVMGPNHAFGHRRAGHHDNIKEYCRERGLEVVEIPEEMWHSAGVHSAVIRDHIRQRDWPTVNAMLGYEYLRLKT